jgi:hypothetical protein
VSTPNPVLVTVAPEIIAIMQALEAFDNAMGPNPADWVGNLTPAKLTLDGAVLKQLQLMAPALAGLGISELNSVWSGIISKVQAATTPAAAK